MKREKPNLMTIFLWFATLFYLTPAFCAETYVNLDRSISKKCGITFSHPRDWKMSYVAPANPDEKCIIAYRDKKKKKVVLNLPMVETWREYSDGGFVVKKIPLREQLAEFNFKIDGNGNVYYAAEAYTEFAAQDGYTPSTIDSFDIVQQVEGTLYIGRAHYFRRYQSKGKSLDIRTQNIDLLFGNESISVGSTAGETEAVPDSRGKIFIYEKIYKSMKLLGHPQ